MAIMFVVDTFDANRFRVCLAKVLNKFGRVSWAWNRVKSAHHDRNGFFTQHKVQQFLVLSAVFDPFFLQILETNETIVLVIGEDCATTVRAQCVAAVAQHHRDSLLVNIFILAVEWLITAIANEERIHYY